jgi:hypothetical protein
MVIEGCISSKKPVEQRDVRVKRGFDCWILLRSGGPSEIRIVTTG